ncbi:MAG: murein transglycosylase A [Parvularculaceae bacterium]
MTMNGRVVAAAVAAALFAAALVALFSRPGAPAGDEIPAGYALASVGFERVDFSELEGWDGDDAAASLRSFRLSCAQYADKPADAAFGADPRFGRIGDWLAACAAASSVPSAGARAFFEGAFAPVRLIETYEAGAGAPRDRGPVARRRGLVTGYFEPIYPGAVSPDDVYAAPALERPADLVTVDLGRFRNALSGERIAGRVVDGRLEPYPSRAEINGGALSARATALAYLRPTDLFFLQIQGSGRVDVPGRKPMRLGYDGQNGWPYRAIGRDLIEQGALTRENVTMASIRDWLDAAEPAMARAMRERNASYVFFRELDDLPDPSLGPLGAQGAQLTPRRSLAVDRRWIPLGAPVWLAFEEAPIDADLGGLYVAQDVGGAIRGPLRGDVFIGAGDAAGALAGRLKARASFVVFVPRASLGDAA